MVTPATLNTNSQPFVDKPTKILIADDNNTDRLLLKTILVKQGHEVVIACDGKEAVAVFQQQQPHIVLMDALMPGMDGFEAAEKIKKLSGEQFIPIIFLTSLREADSLARCLDAGGDDFLSKPYNSVILRAKINAFSRMRDMHHTVQVQRDEISAHNDRLLREQEVAKRVFDKIAHAGCLDADNINYSLSPLAIFNGDVALAGVSPAGSLVVLLGDFTGHGLDAAVGAMPLAQSFYGLLEKGLSIQDIMLEINTKLFDILPTDVFCCVMVAEINFNNGTLKSWNAGLPDAFIYRPSNKTIIRLHSRHLPLGVRDVLDFKHSVQNVEVLEGDRLFIWTDGIHEAANREGEMFGEERLLQVFEKNNRPDCLFDELNSALNTFVADGKIADDVSLVEVTIVRPEAFSVEVSNNLQSGQVGPSNWELHYQLQQPSMKDFDPLPMLLHVLMYVPFLRSSSGQIYTVMSELYTNALEHGVLGLDSTIKNSPRGFNDYYRQRQQRLEDLNEGVISVGLAYNGDMKGGQLQIIIEDSGKGFDYIQYMQSSNQTLYSGRGISLLRSICHSVEYSGVGNKVTAIFLWGDQTAQI